MCEIFQYALNVCNILFLCDIFQPIPSNTELRVWYSRDYAKSIGKGMLASEEASKPGKDFSNVQMLLQAHYLMLRHIFWGSKLLFLILWSVCLLVTFLAVLAVMTFLFQTHIWTCGFSPRTLASPRTKITETPQTSGWNSSFYPPRQ